jgi:hypothetical protein
MQICSDTFTLIFLDGYLGKDSFFLQVNIPPVVAHDAVYKVSYYNAYK